MLIGYNKLHCGCPHIIFGGTKNNISTQNPLICPLIEEYISSRSEIEREGSSPSILTGVEKIT